MKFKKIFSTISGAVLAALSVFGIGDVNVQVDTSQMTSILGGFTDFTQRVTENISITFRQMANFLKFFEVLFYNAYFFIVFLVFIALLAAIFIVPIWAYPYYEKWKTLYGNKLGLLLKKS